MPKQTMQVEAIEHGTVLDHIPSEVTLRVAELLAGPDDQVFIGVNLPSSKFGRKGVVKIGNRELGQLAISRIALLAPQASMVIIRDYRVIQKGRIPVPESFAGIATCPNGNCVSNHEGALTRFDVVNADPLRVRCHYCERHFAGEELG